MTQAVTPARARGRKGSAALARCTATVADTGVQCHQRTRWGTCSYHSRWMPPLVHADVRVTLGQGTGECALCVRGGWPGHVEPRPSDEEHGCEVCGRPVSRDGAWCPRCAEDA